MNLNYIKSQKWKEQKASFTKRKVIAIAIVLLLLLCVWPIGLVTKPIESKSLACNYYETASIQNEVTVEQEFIPNYSFLERIELQLSLDGFALKNKEGKVQVSLYNDKGDLLHSERIAFSEIANRQYQTFQINQKIEAGKTYVCKVEGLQCENGGPRIRYGEKDKIGLSENQNFYYGGEHFPEASVVALYQYRVPLEPADILVYDTWIVTMAFLCYTKLKLLWNKEELLE